MAPSSPPRSSPTCLKTTWTTTGTSTIILPPSPGSFWKSWPTAAPPRGLAVLNLDDPRGRQLKDAVRGPALTYGLHPDSLVRPLSYRFRQDGLEARLTTPAGEVEITSRLVGPFNLANILAAAATALGLGIDPDTVARGIAALPGVPGRLERFGPPAGPGVFVDYAHTPAAVTQALAALHTLNFSRLITVFGCGGDRDRGKRPLMGAAAAAGSQLVIVTSDNPRTEDPLAIIREIEAGPGEERPAAPRRRRGPKRRGGLPGGPGPPGGYPPGRVPGPTPARRSWWPAKATKTIRSGGPSAATSTTAKKWPRP